MDHTASSNIMTTTINYEQDSCQVLTPFLPGIAHSQFIRFSVLSGFLVGLATKPWRKINQSLYFYTSINKLINAFHAVTSDRQMLSFICATDSEIYDYTLYFALV